MNKILFEIYLFYGNRNFYDILNINLMWRSRDRVWEQQGHPCPHLPLSGQAGGQGQAGGGHDAAAGTSGEMMKQGVDWLISGFRGQWQRRTANNLLTTGRIYSLISSLCVVEGRWPPNSDCGCSQHLTGGGRAISKTANDSCWLLVNYTNDFA